MACALPPGVESRASVGEMIGQQDLLIGLVLAVFLFGAKKLPELAGSLGRSIQEFKKGAKGDSDGGAPGTPATRPAAPPASKRTCASCQTPLEAEWAHCPRCGGATPPLPSASPR